MSHSGRRVADETSDNAYGVSIFAGVLMLAMGAFEILQGLSAILKDDVLLSGPSYSYELDLTTWGWINLVLGLVVVATGVGILRGQTWANSVGIGFAVLSALDQFAFLPYYPIWSVLIIALDVVVIWALATQIKRA